MGAAVLPFLHSLLLVIAAVGAAAGAEAAMIRPAAAAGNNMVVGETTLCCPNMTEYHECVEACFAFYPKEDAEKFCDRGCQEAYQCLHVSGDKCPSPSGHHHSSPDLLVTTTTDSSAGDEVVAQVQVQVQAQVQTGGTTLCCSNMTEFHECVEACFAFFPSQGAEKFCEPGCKEAYQCHTVSGDEECRPASGRHHRSSSHDDSSAKGNAAAVDHCILGCTSSVCNKMLTGVGHNGVVKHAVERCNNACYKFCTQEGGVRPGTSTA